MNNPHRPSYPDLTKVLSLLVMSLFLTLAFAQDTFDYPSWMWSEGAVGEWQQARLAEFEAAHPEFTVQDTQIASGDFEGAMLTRLAAGDAPDLMPAFTNMLPPLIEADMLEPLDDYLANSDLKDRLLPSIDFATADGKTYGIPLTMSPWSLLYNKQLLDEAGVAVPTTIEEFYAAAKAVKKKTEAWGYAFHSDTSNVLLSYIVTMEWVLGFGSDWSAKDGTITANAPANVEALTGCSGFRRRLESQRNGRFYDAVVVRRGQGRVPF